MATSLPGEKMSRDDWKKRKELEEARKAGTAPAEVDESGKYVLLQTNDRRKRPFSGLLGTKFKNTEWETSRPDAHTHSQTSKMNNVFVQTQCRRAHAKSADSDKWANADLCWLKYGLPCVTAWWS